MNVISIIKNNSLTALIAASVIGMTYLVSCSDDLEVRQGLIRDAESDLTVTLVMPEADHIITRDGEDSENQINNLSILLCDDSDIILKREDFNGEELQKVKNALASPEGEYIYQAAIPSEERVKVKNIYAIANTKISTTEDLLEKFNVNAPIKFKEIYSNNLQDVEGGFMMSGVMDEDRILPLHRTAAKITLMDESGVKDFKILGWKVYGVSENAFLMSKVMQSKNNEVNYPWYWNTINTSEQTNENSKEIGKAFNTFENLYYVNPTKTHIDLKVYTYIVIKAQYERQECFYAVPLYHRKDATNNVEGYYDIEPNHWYDLRIVRVEKPGSDSVREAILNHNDNQIWVDIHDHDPRVFTMISDGIHELGATRNLSLTKTNSAAELIIKCFAADMDNINSKEISFEKEDWINIEKKEETVYQKEGGEAPDKDNPGKKFTYTVSVSPDRQVYTEEIATITIKWKGLTREVSLHYDPEYKISDACKVSLTIKPDGKNDQTKFIENYWNFVTGEGTLAEDHSTGSELSQTPKLYGITSDVLVNGKVRTKGFHFPMPYGVNFNTSPWEYVYTLDFSKRDDKDVVVEEIKMTPSKEMTSNLSWNPDAADKSKGTLEWKGSKTSYQYEGGTVNFTITYSDGTPTTEISLSVYHTGFFHYDGLQNYCPAGDFGYYYYEVVPMGSGYWLDRNVGAKGNIGFIDTEDEHIIGDRSFGGRLFTIGTPQSFIGATIDQGMCPPGYHIPNQGEWDDIRLTENFTAQSVTADNNSVYISTYYRTGNEKIGNVYFPKARFYNESNACDKPEKYTMDPNVGDAGGGYYWSTTQAPAMEKEYMGNWLRALYLIGSSASYNNASVYDHRMAIRCKAGAVVQEATEYFVSLNAHNVTHVYLFDKESKTPLYNFPGKALGSASSSGTWQYFYCSTTIPLDQLLVMFTKVDSDGKVYLFTRDGDKYTTDVKYSKDILDETHAWPIQRGYYYDLCETALTRSSGIVTLEEPDECDSSTNTGGGSGGSGGGGYEYTPGGNEVSRGSETNPETPKEIIIWGDGSGYRVDWDWNGDGQNQFIDFDKWNTVPPGSKMRIYGGPFNNPDWWCVSIRNNGWGTFLNAEDGYFQYEFVDGYVEIELTDDLLAELSRGRLTITGGMFNLKYVTLILNGDWITPKLNSGDVTWTGNLDAAWSDCYTDLLSSMYDWSDVHAGSTLKVSWEYKSSQPQIFLKNGNGNQIAGLPEKYSIWTTLPKPIEITFTVEMLNDIKSNGGLKIHGGEFYLTGVELRVK